MLEVVNLEKVEESPETSSTEHGIQDPKDLVGVPSMRHASFVLEVLKKDSEAPKSRVDDVDKS